MKLPEFLKMKTQLLSMKFTHNKHKTQTCLNFHLTVSSGKSQGDHLRGGPTNYVANMRKGLPLSLMIVGLDYIWVFHRSNRSITKDNP